MNFTNPKSFVRIDEKQVVNLNHVTRIESTMLSISFFFANGKCYIKTYDDPEEKKRVFNDIVKTYGI